MLLLLIALTATPDAGASAPSAREMAQLFFQAGDLRRAVDAARRCVEHEGKKKCEPLYRALVEYQALIPKNDQLTPDEAKAYLEWDRQISPKARGKLTEPVVRRYVDAPLSAANDALRAGDPKAARQLLERVLQVDPKNAEARQRLQELK